MDASLYTRCPSCHTVFPLEAKQLAQAGGVVQCGGCQKVFNTLAVLFDEWPSGDAGPAESGGMPPVLPAPSQGNLDLPEPRPEPELDDLLQEIPADAEQDDERPPELVLDQTPAAIPAWHRYAWQAAAGVLLLVGVMQLSTMDAGDRAWLFGGGETSAPDGAQAVQLVSRDLHPHPSLDDAVILSATLVNGGEQAVPYPTLEVRLFDASQQIVGVRRLTPEEYLSDPPDADELMEPRAPTSVVLELVAAGGDPQGFEFRFF